MERLANVAANDESSFDARLLALSCASEIIVADRPRRLRDCPAPQRTPIRLPSRSRGPEAAKPSLLPISCGIAGRLDVVSEESEAVVVGVKSFATHAFQIRLRQRAIREEIAEMMNVNDNSQAYQQFIASSFIIYSIL